MTRAESLNGTHISVRPSRGQALWPGKVKTPVTYAPGAAGQAASDEAEAPSTAAKHLSAAEFADGERSGGSTPSARLTHPGIVTELRPGVYVFNDAQQCGPAAVEMAMASAVLSLATRGQVPPAESVVEGGGDDDAEDPVDVGGEGDLDAEDDEVGEEALPAPSAVDPAGVKEEAVSYWPRPTR
jgi:hypothetical protein